MKKSIQKMVLAISEILSHYRPSIYLYGSYVLGDFQLGWSDIDILVLTQEDFTLKQAQSLVNLRQIMSEQEPHNPYYRLFEGGILTLSSFCSKADDTVIYWGTSGQRITNTYVFDSFCMVELIEKGRLLYGDDIRSKLNIPSYKDLCQDVAKHYEGIRKYAKTTNRSLYSFGWLFDIARGLYTLQTGSVISKTTAAQWALEHNLCPVSDVLDIALKVRKDPLKYKKDNRMLDFAAALGSAIQEFADVLGEALHAVR